MIVIISHISAVQLYKIFERFKSYLLECVLLSFVIPSIIFFHVMNAITNSLVDDRSSSLLLLLFFFCWNMHGPHAGYFDWRIHTLIFHFDVFFFLITPRFLGFVIWPLWFQYLLIHPCFFILLPSVSPKYVGLCNKHTVLVTLLPLHPYMHL